MTYRTDRKTGLPIIDKADGDRLDYPFNFTELLAPVQDEIDTAAPDGFAFVVTGATLMSQQASKYIATAVVEGGTAGVDASVQCTIKTKGGRIFERTILLSIKERM